MSIRKAQTFKQYREASRDYYCSECGRGYPLATRAQWQDDKASVQRHNEWHETATPEDLAAHEADEESRAAIHRALLEFIAPIGGTGPWTHSFGESK